MKPAIYKVMILAALLAIPAVVNAQSTGARFTVPFDFVVNGYSLPAGDYFVEALWWNAVAFHHGKGQVNLILMADRGARTQEVQTKLVFHNMVISTFLAKAELPNTDFSRAFQTAAVSHVIKVAGRVDQGRPGIVEIAGKEQHARCSTLEARPRPGFVLFQLHGINIALRVKTAHQNSPVGFESIGKTARIVRPHRNRQHLLHFPVADAGTPQIFVVMTIEVDPLTVR